ncbi:MAG: pyrroline-5-carboxylate reductase [Xanthobacteraceae bacterium]|nr:pyrroline-5-carboxylate reductase [Xanthobacteraceae bacterium]QYK44431.1 MAG: pyrroline-5-carboxylate reductase [Xanthobacteraceae bacterium]
MSALSALKGTVLLAGAGKMGGALLEGWLKAGLPASQVVVRDPGPPPEMRELLAKHKIELNQDPKSKAAAMILAVKPQVAPEALPPLAAFADENTVVVSVMAGRTISFLENIFPSSPVIRTIPNTPAAIGRGITAATPNRKAGVEARSLADAVLRSTGPVEWLEDEALMDAATAVSGSGPAYVFLLAETLARAGEKAGLPKELAAKLARETVSGAGELLYRSDLPASKLRENVTSPNGTTAAALKILMGEGGFDKLLEEAVAAATKRGKELAG